MSYLKVVAPLTVMSPVSKMQLPVCEWPFLDVMKMKLC